MNIALVNEMVRFSHELDIDLWDAIDCASTKPFGYMPFRPGPGVGGHCIPVDPSYLSHRVRDRLGYTCRMIELAEEINLGAPHYVAQRVSAILDSRGLLGRGPTVLLVGVTYRPDVADRRQSPADSLADHLAAAGIRVAYFDPYVESWKPQSGAFPMLWSPPDLYAAAGEADVVVLLQPHLSIDLARLANASDFLLDTRGVVPVGQNRRTTLINRRPARTNSCGGTAVGEDRVAETAEVILA